MLALMLERVAAAKRIDGVLLATSRDASDDPIDEFCRKENTQCFRGSLDDVLDRYYQAAKASGADIVVRLTGDCPLIDPQLIDLLVDVYTKGQYDFVANTTPPDPTFPDGMDVEIFSFKNLERAWQEAKKPSEREHVTFYFWKNPQIFSLYRYDLDKNLSSYRLTVDYPEDFKVIEKIFAELYPRNRLFSMNDIIHFLDGHPSVREENKNIKPNQGWEPALDKDKQAGFIK